MRFKQIVGTIAGTCVIAALFACLHCGQKIAGSEVTNEKYQAALYLPDGKPAKGANVLIIRSDYIPSNGHGVQADAGVAVIRITTDEKGRYSLQALADSKTGNSPDLYNILADLDSLVVLHDSIQVLSSYADQLKDTLKSSASFSGSVKIQPNHDVSTVIVQAIGTNIFVNVNSQGQFTIPRLAQGMYRLKISTSLQDYVPSYVPVIVSGQGNNALSSPITLHYSGIPVITGLRAWFDTTYGTVHLSWNATDFTDLADYVVYRDPFDSIQLSTKPVAAVQDTFFVDTVIFPYTEAGTWRYKYRVAARNNSYQTGLTYKYVSVTAVSLGAFSIHITERDTNNVVNINKPVCFAAEINSPRIPIKKIQWKLLSPTDSVRDSLVQSRDLVPAQRSASDTICLFFNRTPGNGYMIILCTSEDSLGRTMSDSISFWVADSFNLDSIDTIRPVHTGFRSNSEFNDIMQEALLSGKDGLAYVFYQLRRTLPWKRR